MPTRIGERDFVNNTLSLLIKFLVVLGLGYVTVTSRMSVTIPSIIGSMGVLGYWSAGDKKHYVGVATISAGIFVGTMMTNSHFTIVDDAVRGGIIAGCLWIISLGKSGCATDHELTQLKSHYFFIGGVSIASAGVVLNLVVFLFSWLANGQLPNSDMAISIFELGSIVGCLMGIPHCLAAWLVQGNNEHHALN